MLKERTNHRLGEIFVKHIIKDLYKKINSKLNNEKTKISIKRWTKDFTKKITRIANKHMKRCSTLLISIVFKETQSKTIMGQLDIYIQKNVYTSIRTAKMKSGVENVEEMGL